MHFKVSATSAENTDTLPKNVGVRSKEEQRRFNARSVEKDCTDTVGHEVTQQQQENHRKDDGKVVEKETAKEHRRVVSPKAEKVEPNGKGKGKGKKDQRIHELNRQKNKGQMDLGNSGQNSCGRLKPTM